MEEEDSFQHLSNSIANAFSQPATVKNLRRLQTVLIHHKTSFLTPLQNPPKNAAQRKQVEDGEVVIDNVRKKLPKEFSQQALVLSDDLNLNEISSVMLLRSAYEELGSYALEAEEVLTKAELIYFAERQHLLHSLLNLLRGRGDPDISEGLRALIIQFTNELIAEGLAKRLIDLVLTNEPAPAQGAQAPSSTAAQEKRQRRIGFYAEERVLLVSCLLSIYYQVVIPPEEALALIDLYEKCSSALKKNPTDMDLLHVTQLLLITILCFLDVERQGELVDARNEDGIGGGSSSPGSSLSARSSAAVSLLTDKRFLSDFTRKLTSKWRNAFFQGPVMFAWALYLHFIATSGLSSERVEEKDILFIFNKALKKGAFPCLTAVVESKPFRQDEDNKDVAVSVLDDLVTSLILNMSTRIREMKIDEEDALRNLNAYRDFRVGARPDPVPPHFGNLLRLVAAVEKEGTEDFALKFWGIQGQHPQARQLFRFLRFAGESMNELFFVPYISMLASLAKGNECAVNAFHFLKNSVANHLSWDHFFKVLERYYLDFQETPLDPGLYYRGAQPSAAKEMRPEDVAGLIAILKLMQEVLRHSADNRKAMCENPSWHPLETLFGLLSCPVPSQLKAEILETITTFAITPEIAMLIWPLLEASQILVTTSPSGRSPQQEGGIRFELEEREARAREYPQLIAFLELLYQLLLPTTPAFLRTLGSEHREPGFLPYLSFLVENVFLRFDSRGYLNPGEQWRVASAALKIFLKILEDTSFSEEPSMMEKSVGTMSEAEANAIAPSEMDVPSSSSSPAVPLSAGFVLMQEFEGGNLLLLRKVLTIISQGATNLEIQRLRMEDGEAYEESVLLCLKLIETVMEKEEEFTAYVRTSRLRILTTSMDQLLLRDRSRIVDIARFVSYPHRADLCLASVRIVDHLSQRTDKLVSIFLEDPQEARFQILAGFVSRLETDEPEIEGEMETLPPDLKEKQLSNLVRESILQLLLRNLDIPAPNLTHFILGFDVTKPLHDQSGELQSKEMMSYKSLNVILSLMRSRSFGYRHPKLAELCYEFVFRLCSHKQTSKPVMRYLRNRSQDFFYRQLRNLPMRILTPTRVSQLRQCAWLLKTIALEIHVVASLDQRTDTQRLLSLLFGGPLPQESEEEGDYNDEYEAGEFEDMEAWEQQRMKILELLQPIDIPLKDPPQFGGLTFFTPELINSCLSAYNSLHMIDIKKLHHLLAEEQRRMELDYSMSANHHGQITEEIRNILQVAVQRNSFAELLASKLEFFEAWKQLTEVTISKCYDYLQHSLVGDGERILYDLLDILLQRLSSEETRVPLAEKISGVVLSLMTKLREQKRQSGNQLSPDDLASGQYLPVEQLTSTLRNIVAGLLRHGTSQYMRGNLYAALLNYLQFTRSAPNLPLHTTSQELNYERMLWHAQELESQQQQLDKQNFDILEGAGEKLMEVISSDACHATKVWKSVAFATLDVLLADDRKHSRLQFLSHRGYLRDFLDIFIHSNNNKEDNMLQVLLRPDDAAALKQVYVYESTVSMLSRIAQTRVGATLLVEEGIFQRLIECEFIDHRPEYSAMAEEDMEWLPSVSELYHQLLLPVLRLTVSLLVALPRNNDVLTKACEFINAHSELFSTILKDRAPTMHPDFLEEVELVTSIFYLLNLPQPLAFLPSSSSSATKSSSRRSSPSSSSVATTRTSPLLALDNAANFHHLLMNLLYKYCTRKNWASQKKKTGRRTQPFTNLINGGTDVASVMHQRDEERVDALIRCICRNLVAYCRILTDSPRDSSGMPVTPVGNFRVLFTPSFAGGSVDGNSDEDFPLAISGRGKAPSLGILASYLDDCLKQHEEAREQLKTARFQYEHIIELPSEEITNLASRTHDVSEETSLHQRQHLAQLRLSDIIVEKEKDIATLLYILENTLLLLWRHLFYFSSSLPSSSSRVTASFLAQELEEGIDDFEETEGEGMFGEEASSMELASEGGRRGSTPATRRGKRSKALPLILSRNEWEDLRRNAEIVLEGPLRRIAKLEKEEQQPKWKGNLFYLLVRAIKDILLQQPDQQQQTQHQLQESDRERLGM